MRLRNIGGFAFILLIAVGFLAGCGSSGPSAEEKHEAKVQRERAEKRRAKAIALERQDECEAQLGSFLEGLEELNARLEVGLNYTEYSQELGSIQVAYNRIPLQELDARCLSRVGVPSEKAFQEFVAAGEVWDECIEALTCGDEVSPEVQSEWIKGSEKLEAAADIGMTELGVPTAADLVAVSENRDQR